MVEERALRGKEINQLLGHQSMSATWAFMSRFRKRLGKEKGSPIMRSELYQFLYGKNKE